MYCIRDTYGHLMAVWDEQQYCGGCISWFRCLCFIKTAVNCTKDGKKKAKLIRSNLIKTVLMSEKTARKGSFKRYPGPSPGTRKDPGTNPGTIKDPGPSPGTINDPGQIQTGSGPARDMPSPDLATHRAHNSQPRPCPGTTVPGTGHHKITSGLRHIQEHIYSYT